MPALKSQVIIPVPPPTLPSATGPSLAVRRASSTCSSLHVAPGDVVQPGVVALAHQRDDDVVLVRRCRGNFSTIHFTAASETAPTLRACW